MDGILALVSQIAPEPQELCGESSAMLPLQSGSFEALEVATTPASLDRWKIKFQNIMRLHQYKVKAALVQPLIDWLLHTFV
jgi:hypothetical protein